MPTNSGGGVFSEAGGAWTDIMDSENAKDHNTTVDQNNVVKNHGLLFLGKDCLKERTEMFLR